MISEKMNAQGVFTVTCVGADGKVKWSDVSNNIIVYEGKDALLTKYLAGSSYTSAVYMSLITAGTATTGSTYASPTITEVTSSVVAARLPVTFTAAASGAINANTVSFPIVGSGTITGNYVINGGSAAATVGDTAGGGVMFSSSQFTSGSKAVLNGDTINIVYSVSV
jgi:hypothetical protein